MNERVPLLLQYVDDEENMKIMAMHTCIHMIDIASVNDKTLKHEIMSFI
jgi:Ser-tRNA(Ala) deacylase AlaX